MLLQQSVHWLKKKSCQIWILLQYSADVFLMLLGLWFACNRILLDSRKKKEFIWYRSSHWTQGQGCSWTSGMALLQRLQHYREFRSPLTSSYHCFSDYLLHSFSLLTFSASQSTGLKKKKKAPLPLTYPPYQRTDRLKQESPRLNPKSWGKTMSGPLQLDAQFGQVAQLQRLPFTLFPMFLCSTLGQFVE